MYMVYISQIKISEPVLVNRLAEALQKYHNQSNMLFAEATDNKYK